MRSNPSLTALLIGDFEQPEFRAAASQLAQGAAVRKAAQLEQAIADCRAAALFPDLIVLAQSRPGEFDLARLAALRQWAPLARLIDVLGSWCAGEARSGMPLAGVARLYWHEAAAYFEREFQRHRAGECPDWGLPATATEFDRGFTHGDQFRENFPRSIAVHSTNRELADLLVGACQAWGFAATRIRSADAPAVETSLALIWDAELLDDAELAALRNWAPVPRLVLLGFPHGDDQRRANAAGAHCLLAKPLRLDDLRWHLDRLCDPARQAAAR